MAALRRRRIKRYGWIPDLPDHRDRIYSAPFEQIGPLPPRINLRRGCPPVYEQGSLGSCTANAIAAALEFDQIKQQQADVFVPSRLFIYYNERVIEGTVGEDSGAMIRDGIKSVAKQGAPHEPLWPYVIAQFARKPTPRVYRDALKHQAVIYQRLPQTAEQMKGCLASGFPFVFGFSVYESFQSERVARSGVVPLPAAGERQLGGHAVLCVGYDDDARRFTARNSWGAAWGKKGYFTIPYAYLLDPDLSADFWTIRMVE